MHLLVTNDDGIESEGLHVLVATLAEAGHHLTVVAPDRDWSGAGAALGRIHTDEHIEVTRVEVPGAPRVEAWALAGPPGMTVVASRLGAFGPPPDLVVSGINAGLNTGRSILHSGTVGAALAAQNFGLSGLAVSLQSSSPWHWRTAAGLATELLGRLVDAPPRSVLNLNVPATPPERPPAVRWGRLAPFGAVRAAVAGVESGRVQFELRTTNHSPPPDSDQGLVEAGYASLTTLLGVAEAWPDDEESAEVAEPTEPGSIELVERIVPGAPLHPVHRLPDASVDRSLRRPQFGDG
jgi:5'-nucleotidase